MSFITDIRNVSESALSQLADRFGDLPRPLLAAIGAGDVAAEKLAELRESLAEGWDIAPVSDAQAKAAAAVSSVSGLDSDRLQGMASEMKDFAEDLPARVSKVAAEVVESMEKFAADAPVKTQKMVAELPDKVNELRTALSPEQLREAVEGYTQLAGMIYGSLADRGDKTWAKVVKTADVKIVAPAKTAVRTATKATADGAARTVTATKSTATKAANRATATRPTATKPAATKPAAAKAAATKPAATKPTAAKPAADKSTAPKPAATKAAPKSAAPKTATKTTSKPASKPAPKPGPKPAAVKSATGNTAAQS